MTILYPTIFLRTSVRRDIERPHANPTLIFLCKVAKKGTVTTWGMLNRS